MSEIQQADAQPIDPDVDVTVDRPGGGREASVVAVIAAGGVVGAALRYQAGLWWPTRTGTFPWTTFGINVVGCALGPSPRKVDTRFDCYAAGRSVAAVVVFS
ncbi:FluC/FEX family fluoride channel [Jatrophihabitans lederbergiae]|uniref:CrcB family protein n=1 Tax=Jatrophihabitans lederbergiae TaxID=3075547 RepID=A0ABU2JI85_9ACTN|nr:CrcB family protein [Jatrophihabitans sp. DSM 44399]MDT0264433.1 CrcB family protein [Jatrophihabitans sp. DSM 44399]